jgi:hypothetical protein
MVPSSLSLDEARHSASFVFDFFGFLLVASVGFSYSLFAGLFLARGSAAEEGEPIGTRISMRLQLFFWTVAGFSTLVAIFVIDDVYRLATIFPAWGVLAMLIYSWPIWFAVKLFFLNSDDVADYTLEADRSSIDAKWARQRKGNRSLRLQLCLWIAAIISAAFWLLHLLSLPFTALFSFFK